MNYLSYKIKNKLIAKFLKSDENIIKEFDTLSKALSLSYIINDDN